MALRLVRTTGWLIAWLLIAGALLLMGARRSITFYHAAIGDLSQPPNLTAEFVALSISGLMLVGVARIRPIFVARKKAETALRDSEATYRGILDNMADTFYRTDTEGRILICSPSATSLLGYSVDELTGKPLAELYVRAADRDEFLRQLKEHNGRIQGYVGTLRHKDGSHVHVETNARELFDDKGDFLGVEGTARNITDRRHAEEALKRSETQLRLLTDSLPVVIVYVDSNNRYAYGNKLAEEWYAKSRDKLIGASLRDVLGDEGHAILAPYRDRALAGETVKAQETLTYPDGVTRAIEFIYVPNRTKGGQIAGFYGLVTDLTEQEQAKETQSRLMAAIDGLDDIVSVYDAEDRLVYANQALLNFYPDDAEVLRPGATFEARMRDLVSRKTPLDAIGREDEWLAERIERHRNPGPAFELQRQDGITLWMREQKTSDGSIVNIGTDVTERKRVLDALRDHQQQLGLITDNLPASIVQIDSDQRYQFVNRMAEHLLGRPASEIIGQYARDIVGEEFHESLRPRIDAVLSGTQQEFQANVTYPDGRNRQMEFVYVPQIGSDQTIIGYFGLGLDISERHTLEESLRQSQKIDAVGQLTGGVAHDFNNLLGIVIGNLDFLAEELQNNTELLELVHTATTAALSGADLNRQLLAFSRQQPLSPKVIDLNDRLSAMLGMLRRTLGETVEIESNLSDGLWLTDVDPAQVESALLNLAVNARDAMPEGGKLTIQTANVPLDDEYAAAQTDVTPGEYVMLALTDTGVGMTPDTLEHVFEPFFTTKEVGQGTGLGLSMVFGFAKQSRGHVTIYSEVGEGTTVKLYLPRATRAAEALLEVTEDIPAAQGETVLVVEDDPNLRTLVVKMLHDLGYEVLDAADGNSALAAMAQTSRINLLLTDVILPGGMSGPEIAAEAGSRLPGIKALFMSGYPRDAVTRQSRMDDGVLLLEKPFRKVEFARRLREALAARN